MLSRDPPEEIGQEVKHEDVIAVEDGSLRLDDKDNKGHRTSCLTILTSELNSDERKKISC